MTRNDLVTTTAAALAFGLLGCWAIAIVGPAPAEWTAAGCLLWLAVFGSLGVWWPRG